MHVCLGWKPEMPHSEPLTPAPQDRTKKEGYIHPDFPHAVCMATDSNTLNCLAGTHSKGGGSSIIVGVVDCCDFAMNYQLCSTSARPCSCQPHTYCNIAILLGLTIWETLPPTKWGCLGMGHAWVVEPHGI